VGGKKGGRDRERWREGERETKREGTVALTTITLTKIV
jgi:hypothetical protein